MVIRTAQPDECHRVGEVDVRSFVESPYGQKTGLDKDPERQRQRRENASSFCKEHTSWVFVAVEEEEIVGFVTIEHWPEKQAGRIQNSCVLPDSRGRGVSTRLVRHALEELNRLGARQIHVYTKHVPAACRVYEKAGFSLASQEGESYRYEMELQGMPVLSEEDLAFWEENGYVIVHDAVPQVNLDAMVDAIWAFLEIDRDNPEDWYSHPPRTQTRPSLISEGGMVEIYQHQALWDNRQYPKVYRAFSEILGSEKLWVSLDRANMKPPARPDKPEWNHQGMIHWDLDTSQEPIPFGVQGVLYLTDTAENQGGFQCVPGFHRTFHEWVKSQPADRNPRSPDLAGLEVKSIPGRAGDLLIWHRLLAHGNGHNRSDRPRLAQYITMHPTREEDEGERRDRIQFWRERRPAPRWPGDPRQWEHRNGKTAVLTDLGKRLLGLELWS